MSNYRPEGWENPYSLKVSIPDTAIFGHNAENPAYKHFEAGADAMLEGIWKMAKESPTGTFTFDTHTINVFTEEE